MSTAVTFAALTGPWDGHRSLRSHVSRLPGYPIYLTVISSSPTVSSPYMALTADFLLNSAKSASPKDLPHSLRHAFVSALLSRGVPIDDLAAWLGHKSINVTHAIYGHLMPSSLGRAQEVLNAEYSEWNDHWLTQGSLYLKAVTYANPARRGDGGIVPYDHVV
jgi:hypothetical protein